MNLKKLKRAFVMPWSALISAHKRRVDLDILWPSCKQNASSVFAARLAFRAHCLQDPAWMAIPAREVDEIVRQLT